eukprot:UN02359
MYSRLNKHVPRNVLDKLFDNFDLESDSARNSEDEEMEMDNSEAMKLNMEKLNKAEGDVLKADARTKSKKKELERAYSDLRDLRDQFDECQNQLATKTEEVAELSQKIEVNEDTVDENIKKLENKLEDARHAKIQTLTFLDLEITRLRKLLSESDNHNQNLEGDR